MDLILQFFFAVDLKNWKQLDGASVQVDSSVSAFDIVHISRDIAEDLDKVRDWCLSGNVCLYLCLFFVFLRIFTYLNVIEPYTVLHVEHMKFSFDLINVLSLLLIKIHLIKNRSNIVKYYYNIKYI